MLDNRIRQFVIDDVERFTMNLTSEVTKGMEEMPSLDPDTDAMVLEDILGRVYGILIRRDHEVFGKIFMMFADTDYPEVGTALINAHLERMRDEDAGR